MTLGGQRLAWLLGILGVIGLYFGWKYMPTRKEGFQVAPGLSIPTEEACTFLDTLRRPLEMKIPGFEVPSTPLSTQLRALYSKASYEIKCMPEFADTVPIDPTTVCPTLKKGREDLLKKPFFTPEQNNLSKNILILYDYLDRLAGCPAAEGGQ